MLILVLGKGKTGSLVAEVARERSHGVRALDIDENTHASALTAPNLAGVDVVVDFTSPEAAVENMRAVLAIGGRIVVGTTGWYAKLDEMKALAAQRGGGLLYGTNFSIGVQKLFQMTAELRETRRLQVLHRRDAPRYKARCALGHCAHLEGDYSGGAAGERRCRRVTPRGRREGRAHCACSERLRHAGTAPRCTFAARVCAGRGARRRMALRQTGRVGVPRDIRSTLKRVFPDFPHRMHTLSAANLAGLRGRRRG